MSQNVTGVQTETIVIPGWGDGETVHGRNMAPLIIAAVMLGFAWVTIFMRLYTRIYLVYAFGWDDIFMMLALASFSVYSGGIIDISAIDNLLDHMSYPELISAVKGVLLALIFYVATITFLKLSLGIFLVRIVGHKSHKVIVYVVMAISTVWGCVTMMVAIFQCGYPSSAQYYIRQRLLGHCISGDTAVGVTYTHGVISTASDIIYTTLPLFILKEAQINKRAKIVLGIILMLGALGSIASLVRFVYIRELKVVTTRFFLQTTHLSIWSTLECGLGITAGSLATLRPMFRKMLQGARTIGNRTVETITGGSSKNQSSRGEGSRHKSFARRFSLSSKRVTMSTAKRLSDLPDIESYPSPALPIPREGFSEKPYSGHGTHNETMVSVSPLSPTRSKPQSPRGGLPPEWPHRGQPKDGGPFETISETYPGRAYTPRSSTHSSRYESSDHSREQQTWI